MYLSFVDREIEEFPDKAVDRWIQELQENGSLKHYKTGHGIHDSKTFWICCVRHDFHSIPLVAYIHKFYYGIRLLFDYYDKPTYRQMLESNKSSADQNKIYSAIFSQQQITSALSPSCNDSKDSVLPILTFDELWVAIQVSDILNNFFAYPSV